MAVTCFDFGLKLTISVCLPLSSEAQGSRDTAVLLLLSMEPCPCPVWPGLSVPCLRLAQAEIKCNGLQAVATLHCLGCAHQGGIFFVEMSTVLLNKGNLKEMISDQMMIEGFEMSQAVFRRLECSGCRACAVRACRQLQAEALYNLQIFKANKYRKPRLFKANKYRKPRLLEIKHSKCL